MTDADLVAKKLALIETYARELTDEARPELLTSDVRERRFVEHTLQIAIQACLDVASHIVAEERLGYPESNHELFDLLAQHGWIDAELEGKLRAAVGFRNILVHGYAAVQVDVVRDVLEHHVGDLLAFARAMRRRLP